MKPQDYRDVGLIMAAAGKSSRFGGTGNKLLMQMEGEPLFLHALRRFLTRVRPAHTVVVVPAAERKTFRQAMEAAQLDPDLLLAGGGRTRQDSVMAGLGMLPADVTLVAVQDAARPFTSVELLDRCVAAARQHGAGVAAHRVRNTIKRATPDGHVLRTLRRDMLWAAETPQVFRRSLLQEAYAHIRGQRIQVTDEAQAVEALGKPVILVENTEWNPKITYPQDLARNTPS